MTNHGAACSEITVQAVRLLNKASLIISMHRVLATIIHIAMIRRVFWIATGNFGGREIVRAVLVITAVIRCSVLKSTAHRDGCTQERVFDNLHAHLAMLGQVLLDVAGLNRQRT